MKYLATLVLILEVSFSSMAIGNVNEKNGNFYISYTDLYISGPLEVTRTYNSKSTMVGLFGFGWGSVFDTRIVVDPAGFPVIYQNGNGATSYFKPLKPDEQYEKQLDSSLEIMQKILVDQKLDQNTKVDEKEPKERIQDEVSNKLKDEEYRIHEWDRLLRQHKVNPLNIAVGLEFSYTCTCNYKEQHLVKTVDGYRYTSDGQTELFNNDGLLVSLTDASGQTLQIERDQTNQGQIRRILLGNDGIYFFYNDMRQIDRLFHPQSGKVILYRYQNSNLIRSDEGEGNSYRYLYDKEHNMTQITYIDESKMIIKYDPNNNGSAKEVIERNGTTISYVYGSLKGDPELNYFTEIVRTSPETAGRPVKERREYYQQVTSSGSRVLNKTVTVADNVLREYFYDDKGVLKRLEQKTPPDSKNTIVSDFLFDVDGRVQSIKSVGWSRNYVYAAHGSTRIKSLSTQNGVEKSDYEFEYDDKNRLFSANHAGTKVTITYSNGNSADIDSLQTDNHKIKLVREQGYLTRLELENKDGQKESLLLTPNKHGQIKISPNELDKAYLISSIVSGMLSILAPAQANVNLELR